MHDPLIRKKLPPGWIDLAVGEAYIVRQALAWAFQPKMFDVTDHVHDCNYQPPEGYPPLVETLERRHGSPVVVTAGAKQGLSAAFYAAKKLGLGAVAMRTPYWSQMPAAIELAGLEVVISDEPIKRAAYLLVSPNNPDGHVTGHVTALEMQKRCHELGTIMIHDGAYHRATYLGGPAPELADISIHSAAKAYGLSGLRVGYLVTKDERIKQAACEYVEMTTVGVSLLSQHMLNKILWHEDHYPVAAQHFTARAQQLLHEAKEIVQALEPDVLDTSGVTQTNGMFGWFKMGPRFNPDAARVHVAPGAAFGDPSRVRINLAIDQAQLREAVRRLNEVR